jgi:hypothetical protein
MSRPRHGLADPRQDALFLRRIERRAAFRAARHGLALQVIATRSTAESPLFNEHDLLEGMEDENERYDQDRNGNEQAVAADPDVEEQESHDGKPGHDGKHPPLDVDAQDRPAGLALKPSPGRRAEGPQKRHSLAAVWALKRHE